MHPTDIARSLFSPAATEWLEGRRKIGPNTRAYYADCIRSLERFFGQLRVGEIHAGHIAQYQTLRQQEIRATKQHAKRKRGAPHEASDGASRINHEISCVLRPLLRLARRWEAIAPHYEALPLPSDEVGIALSHEEEAHLFRVGRSRGKWMLALCCDLISRNTTAGPGEIRHLRLLDVDLVNRIIHIETGVKNQFRRRPIPLNDDALWAMQWLYDRYRAAAEKAQAPEHPEHYLLYHRAARRGVAPDFSRPMVSWKKAHYAMRAEAAKKFPRLLHLRRYDFRHTACTELLENPAVSYATIEHLMGHRLGSHTKRKYDQRRNAALQSAAEALDHGHAPLTRKPPTGVSRERAVALGRW